MVRPLSTDEGYNSASYKSPKYIYSFIVSTLDLLEPGLSDEIVEIVPDLFLFPPFFPHFQETISVWDIMVLSVQICDIFFNF
jgi:hypothetical protein